MASVRIHTHTCTHLKVHSLLSVRHNVYKLDTFSCYPLTSSSTHSFPTRQTHPSLCTAAGSRSSRQCRVQISLLWVFLQAKWCSQFISKFLVGFKWPGDVLQVSERKKRRRRERKMRALSLRLFVDRGLTSLHTLIEPRRGDHAELTNTKAVKIFPLFSVFFSV